MKKLIVPMCIAMAAAAFAFTQNAAAASTEGKQLTPQQQRMAACSHESKGMKAAERKKFMSDCLKGKADDAAAAGKADEHNAAKTGETGEETGNQREKMRDCNTHAKDKSLKGADRKKFMSDCLKSDGK